MQLGGKDRVQRTPKPMVATGMQRLFGGGTTSCSIDAAGDASCWGNNFRGRLGSTVVFPVGSPVPVANIQHVTDIAISLSQHVCAVADGAVWCWGRGAIGNDTPLGNEAHQPVPTAITAGATSIGVNDVASCATVGVGISCWGQVGLETGAQTTTTAPVPVLGVDDAVRMLGGSCYLTTAGTVKCWGVIAQDGQPVREATAPEVIPGLTNVKKIAGAPSSTLLALTNDGALKVWGLVRPGYFGASTTSFQSTALDVSLGATVVDLTDSCAVLATGAVSCFGTNENGERANGTSDGYQVYPPPSLVPGLVGTAVEIAGTMVRMQDGSGYAWSADGDGQLGVGRVVMTASPVAIPLPL
jgi:alpha-tubulin suppressor-like RCC1 family protein